MVNKARPSFDETWLKVAGIVAQRGTCPRRQVGAVIADRDNQIVSTGYNGAPRGLPDCGEVGCLMEGGRCKRTAHAEANALLQAGRLRTVGATLYSTDFPCSECANLIIQAGLARVMYVRPYESQPTIQAAIMDALDVAGIEVERAYLGS